MGGCWGYQDDDDDHDHDDDDDDDNETVKNYVTNAGIVAAVRVTLPFEPVQG